MKHRFKKKRFLFWAVLAVFTCFVSTSVWGACGDSENLVTVDESDTDGDTYPTFKTLKAALDDTTNVLAGCIITVKPGTYSNLELGNNGTLIIDRAITITSESGYACTDGGVILSGDKDGNDDTDGNGTLDTITGDNVRVVKVTADNVTFRGVTIQNGYANISNEGGGGVYVKAKNFLLENSIVKNNQTVKNNFKGGGGGLQILGEKQGSEPWNGSATLINTLVSGNSASSGSGSGGGICSINADLRIISSTIAGNLAGLRGGGIAANFDSKSTGENTSINSVNSIIWGNYAKQGSQIHTKAQQISCYISRSNIMDGDGAGLRTASGTFYFPTAADPSNQTWLDGTNTTSDPLFIDDSQIVGVASGIVSAPTLLGDYRLLRGSPSVNTGDDDRSLDFSDTGFPGFPVRDIEGNDRPQGSFDDMGAYECAVLSVEITTQPSYNVNDKTVSFEWGITAPEGDYFANIFYCSPLGFNCTAVDNDPIPFTHPDNTPQQYTWGPLTHGGVFTFKVEVFNSSNGCVTCQTGKAFTESIDVSDLPIEPPTAVIGMPWFPAYAYDPDPDKIRPPNWLIDSSELELVQGDAGHYYYPLEKGDALFFAPNLRYSVPGSNRNNLVDSDYVWKFYKTTDFINPILTLTGKTPKSPAGESPGVVRFDDLLVSGDSEDIRVDFYIHTPEDGATSDVIRVYLRVKANDADNSNINHLIFNTDKVLSLTDIDNDGTTFEVTSPAAADDIFGRLFFTSVNAAGLTRIRIYETLTPLDTLQMTGGDSLDTKYYLSNPAVWYDIESNVDTLGNVTDDFIRIRIHYPEWSDAAQEPYLRLLHYPDTIWIDTSLTATVTPNPDITNNLIYGRTNALSPWVVAYDSSLATLITLESFTVSSGQDGRLMEWETASEVDNMGFYILRSTSKNGKYERINADIIAATGDVAQNAYYSFLDETAEDGITYYYRLEDVNTKGESTIHGQTGTKKKKSENPVPTLSEWGIILLLISIMAGVTKRLKYSLPAQIITLVTGLGGIILQRL